MFNFIQSIGCDSSNLYLRFLIDGTSLVETHSYSDILWQILNMYWYTFGVYCCFFKHGYTQTSVNL